MQPDGCILCPDQCKFIWNTSWSSLASVAYAIYRGHYSLSMVAGSVLLSSLNYLLMTISLACYPAGIFFYNIGDYWTSTYIHSALHIIANISNMALYSGGHCAME